MGRSILLSVSLSVLAFTLAGCQTATSPDDSDSALAPAPVVSSLEQRVQTLETQMKAVQPTLKKVDAIERHFKSLSFELDKIAETYKIEETTVVEPPAEPVPAVAPAAPTPTVEKVETQKPVLKQAEPAPQKQVQKPVAQENKVFAVTSVRIGEQGKNITRIVLDTTKAATINYDLDNTEGLLVIEIPKAKWSTTESQIFQKSPMVKSFRAESDEQGVRFVTDLKQKAKVVATARLNPSGTSGHRVYIDLAPAQ